MRYLLIFSALFFFSPIFSQSDANQNFLNDLDTTRPYDVPSNIHGFPDRFVMAAPFAGSTASQQITWMLTVTPGGYFQIKDSSGNILKPNSLILPGYTLVAFDQDSLPLGSDIFYPKEGPWTVVERILNTDSLQFAFQQAKLEAKQRAAELASDERVRKANDQYEAEFALQQRLEKEAFLRNLKILGMIVGLLFFALICFVFYKMHNSPSAKGRRAQKKKEILARKRKQIQLNLENGIPVYLAGEPQISGGLDPINGKKRLEYLAGATIIKFAPVRVEFLKPVTIGYASTLVTFQPKTADSTIYYLGETEWEVIVLCAMRCGNSIIGAEGQNLQLGTDFIVVEAVQNEEIQNYLWAANFVTEKSTAE